MSFSNSVLIPEQFNIYPADSMQCCHSSWALYQIISENEQGGKGKAFLRRCSHKKKKKKSSLCLGFRTSRIDYRDAASINSLELETCTSFHGGVPDLGSIFSKQSSPNSTPEVGRKCHWVPEMITAKHDFLVPTVDPDSLGILWNVPARPILLPWHPWSLPVPLVDSLPPSMGPIFPTNQSIRLMDSHGLISNL